MWNNWKVEKKNAKKKKQETKKYSWLNGIKTLLHRHSGNKPFKLFKEIKNIFR